jgi:hypothetical protein
MRVRDAASLLMDMDYGFITPEENEENTQNVIENWYLGPDEPSSDPEANSDYWDSFAEIMNIDGDQARRMFCANCEYFDNSVGMIAKMEAIPYNDFDVNGGGRGYCTKFDFICHNLRVCQAWEEDEEGGY